MGGGGWRLASMSDHVGEGTDTQPMMTAEL